MSVRRILRTEPRKVAVFAVAILLALYLAKVSRVPAARSLRRSNGTRWDAAAAWDWYLKYPIPVGANYIPANAINELEMWQEETFDPVTIDKELGWAASKLKMNTMRVFLHNIPFEKDPAGFLERVGTYLSIADKHGISTILVLFDSCWDPVAVSGPQPAPIPHIHNSGWVQCPSHADLQNKARWPALKKYVQGVVARFALDPRILMWDLYNEPSNTELEGLVASRRNRTGRVLPKADKLRLVAELLTETVKWVRAIRPAQPLTTGPWRVERAADGGVSDGDGFLQLQLDASDIITFHSYEPASRVEKYIAALQSQGRPIVLTEYLARGYNSLATAILPLCVSAGVGAINWGLVSGKSQTIHPWSSWTTPHEEAVPWHHDLFHPNGTPYSPDEVETFDKVYRMQLRVVRAV